MFTAPVGTKPDISIIKKAIKYNEDRKPKLEKLQEYYDGDHEILERIKVEALKNNKIVVNHARYITQINVGYLLGNPVEYQSKKKPEDIEPIVEEYKKQNIRNLDSILAKECSKFGLGYEYVYVNENSDAVSKKIPPFNCVIVYDDTLDHKKLFAVVYEEADINSKEYVGVWTVDDFEKITWTKKLDKDQSANHQFGDVPMIEYANNDDRIGDYEQVVTLIDAYNTLQSDRVNDKEQLGDAILMLYGFGLTKKQLTSLKENRVMSAPAETEGAKAEYLTKNLDEEQAEVLKTSIEDNIHKISMTPNMTDENFVGNSSGVALKFKLLPFEIAVNDKESSFEVGLMERFKLYNTYLGKRDAKVTEVPIHEVDAVFKKTLPQNDFEMSQIILNLMDLVDKETLLSQISFVQDASEVIEKAEKEGLEDANDESSEFGKDEPNKGDADEE